MMKARTEEIAERVVVLLNKVWSGSQTRMANDIGVSQSAISNVVTGRQSAGRKLLAAISGHPLVNVTWLMTGAGDPISVTTESGQRALYVAKCLFEGPPEDNGDCLGAMLEVPTRYYRPSRYWMEIELDNPLIHATELRVAAGDMVLFEPQERGWPESLIGCPCIVRVVRKQLQLSWVQATSLSEVRLGELAAYPQRPKVGDREPRVVQLDNGPVPSLAHHRLSRKRIVAVGVYRCGEFPQKG